MDILVDLYLAPMNNATGTFLYEFLLVRVHWIFSGVYLSADADLLTWSGNCHLFSKVIFTNFHSPQGRMKIPTFLPTLGVVICLIFAHRRGVGWYHAVLFFTCIALTTSEFEHLSSLSPRKSSCPDFSQFLSCIHFSMTLFSFFFLMVCSNFLNILDINSYWLCLAEIVLNYVTCLLIWFMESYY